jgi:hypothetical protein
VLGHGLTQTAVKTQEQMSRFDTTVKRDHDFHHVNLVSASNLARERNSHREFCIWRHDPTEGCSQQRHGAYIGAEFRRRVPEWPRP